MNVEINGSIKTINGHLKDFQKINKDLVQKIKTKIEKTNRIE